MAALLDDIFLIYRLPEINILPKWLLLVFNIKKNPLGKTGYLSNFMG